MLFQEALDDLQVHPVVVIGVALQSRVEQIFIPEAPVELEFGVLGVHVSDSGHVTTFPIVMSEIEVPVHRHHKGEAKQDKCELVDVLQLSRVNRLNHFD